MLKGVTQEKPAKALRMRVRVEDDLVFCEKIAGMNTHASDIGKVGLVELLQEELGETLYVVHRLDQGTSGAIVFARTREAAAELGALFESRDVAKKYLFLTDRRIDAETLEARSFISRVGNDFVSDPDSAQPNAVTTFRRLMRLRLGDLWEALPETGKPHQIRLHAQDLGLPLLGDDPHGGSPFPRLCLHARSLRFQWRGRPRIFETAAPVWTQDLEGRHAVILDGVQARAHLFDLSAAGDESLRLLHDESPLCQIDQYGPQVVVSWYDERDPDAADLKTFELLSSTMGKPFYVRKMQDKGRDPNAKTSWRIGAVQETWTARENGVAYELRLDSGQSPGLFLDQRENRLWVRGHARGKKVLNLFAYTGGFSVNAALGGAAEVCTVDVSAKFNEWTARNFALNGLDPEDSKRYEFWAQDCLLFLKGAMKRKRQWDLIVCDPPSFGRSKEGVFQIQKNLRELLQMCFECLSRGGRLLLSTNYEQWDLEDLRKQVMAARTVQNLSIEPTPRAGLDFERPGRPALMKSLFILKK